MKCNYFYHSFAFRMVAFQDIREVHGLRVPLLKKAQILVAGRLPHFLKSICCCSVAIMQPKDMCSLVCEQNFELPASSIKLNAEANPGFLVLI